MPSNFIFSFFESNIALSFFLRVGSVTFRYSYDQKQRRNLTILSFFKYNFKFLRIFDRLRSSRTFRSLFEILVGVKIYRINESKCSKVQYSPRYPSKYYIFLRCFPTSRSSFLAPCTSSSFLSLSLREESTSLKRITCTKQIETTTPNERARDSNDVSNLFRVRRKIRRS